MSFWTVRNNVDNTYVGGINTTTNPYQYNGGANARTQRTDAFAQYDRQLEHGFNGERYEKNKLIGGLLNYEA